MKINSCTVLVGKKVALVPYKDKHVPRYHEWMQSAELLEQTASERLTLEQEYEMQQSWFNDENKCTFIVLDKINWIRSDYAEIESMAGDVNLFFNNEDDPHNAEIEVMIAESSCRRQGFGKEATTMMMNYGVSKLGITKFSAKIGFSNTPSLMMFQKLGFTEVSSSQVFQETTLELCVTEQTKHQLKNCTTHVTQHSYPYIKYL